MSMCPKDKIQQIIDCIDLFLDGKGLKSISAVAAAEVLDKAGILKDSHSRPGKPLRDILRKNKIPYAKQDNKRWFIPHSSSEIVKEKYVNEKAKLANNDCKDNEALTTFDVSQLLNRENFLKVDTLSKSCVPDSPGLYAIRIKDIDILPKDLINELEDKKSTLLYVGIASKSLKSRLWEQELHAQHPATFFRTIGAVLGFLPPKGSLYGHKNQHNYKFSIEDTCKIIDWINNFLLVNYVVYEGDLKSIEKSIIQDNYPIMNIALNPKRLDYLVKLRNKCKSVARFPSK